ncbi:MAG: hypothetical protein AB1457_08835 [Chloroflexota bacterium]
MRVCGGLFSLSAADGRQFLFLKGVTPLLDGVMVNIPRLYELDMKPVPA